MGYCKLPNFDDPFAKIKERLHPQSGAKIIEVLYGGKRPDGTPTYPEGKEDGHGHFIALEIDGTYQLISWRHPESEGGYHEYGDYKDEKERKDIWDNGADRNHNPLMDLENDIKEKKRLLHTAREKMKGRKYDISSVDEILRQFNDIYDMNTPVEQELKRQYNELVKRNDENRVRFQIQDRNAEQKRKLISQAQELQYSENWSQVSRQMKELMNSWKEAGTAGADDEALWMEFHNAQQTFYRRQQSHFEELDRIRKQAKKQKEEIISEARSVAQNSTEWKKTHECLKALLAKWKQSNSAGKDDDELLWREFQSIQNDFYARRKAAAQEKEQEFLLKRQAKAAIVSEAQAYAKACDYSVAAANRMRELSEEWKKVGFCGKENENELWSQFRAAQDAYWQGKRSSGEQKHRAWVANTQAAIERRKQRIRNIQRNIDNLRDRLNTTYNDEKISQIEGWISENEDDIRALEAEIYRMETELREE